MTHKDCGHYVIDQDKPYCDHCRDEYYIGTPLYLNGVNYTVWQWYADDSCTGETFYMVKRDDGQGMIYLTTADIDQEMH